MREKKAHGITMRFEADHKAGIIENASVFFRAYIFGSARQGESGSDQQRTADSEITSGDKDEKEGELIQLGEGRVAELFFDIAPSEFVVEIYPLQATRLSQGDPSGVLLDGMLKSQDAIRNDLIRCSRGFHAATLVTLLVLLVGVVALIFSTDPAAQVTVGVITTVSAALSLYIRGTLLANKKQVELQLAERDKRMELLYRRASGGSSKGAAA